MARSALFFLTKRQRDAVERRIRGRQELAKLRRADCVIVSYSKSGRTWLRVMLWKFYQLRFGLSDASMLAFDMGKSPARGVPRVMFTHDTYTADAVGPRNAKAPFHLKKVILMVRHPGDVAVSNYFQWKYRTNAAKLSLIGLPLHSEDVSIFDFVMSSNRGLPSIVPFMNAWGSEVARMKEHLVVRYEDLRADPAGSLKRILDFVGTPFTDEEVNGAIEFASFENMRRMSAKEGFHWSGSRLTPRDPGNAESHKVRRGKVGGYREYFDDRQSEAVEEYIRGRLIHSFGYDAMLPGPARVTAP